MDVLWAPWRSKYVADASKRKDSEECIFCRALKDEKDERNYVIYRGKYNFVILNIYPYNPGHIMISPNRHVGSIEALIQEEALELFELLKVSLKVLRRVYSPDGFNVGINLGRVAGAGVDSHVHVHVVPRWNGDANFMPVIGGTKVIPESLESSYEKIRKAFLEEMKRPSISEK